ncbi:MAG: hypothetical protein HC817_16940 [Saprospiraceae bacterium]|nr:hypothetical protein [Saprospiraceae bacterium]
MRAAAAIALLVIGASAGIFFTRKPTDTALAAMVEPDFEEAEQFYSNRVQQKITKLVSYNPDPSVLNDLNQIDHIQAELKAELENAPAESRAEIVKRMIENYQIKLGILERVLNYIEKHQIDKQNSQLNNGKTEIL